MSSDRVPTRAEVMGWSPQQLADYLKRINLFGCDKVVLKNSISGCRFVNLSENDLQKFPKLHTPMISKISSEIRKKEEKRSLFGKKVTPKFLEPETTPEDQGWAEDEFDDEEFDDDYESPYSADEDGSVGDYESPNEDADPASEYEPPPSERSEDHKLCPTMPIADGDYIDNRNSHRGPPPVVSPRPPVSTLLSPSQEPVEFKREPSPHRGRQPSAKILSGPPQIFRNNKPGRVSGSNPSPVRGPPRSTVERPSAQSWKPSVPDLSTRSKPALPQPPPPSSSSSSSSSVSRSVSSVRPSPSRFDGRMEQTFDGAHKHNTFPLQNKSLPSRPGLPGPPARHGDSLPPGVQSSSSLPHKLPPGASDNRGGGLDRHSSRPSPPTAAYTKRELDPRWYVGKVTRGQAEGCLKRVRKDGAYLVRDSTRQLENQPYTLMVYYQDKVYNIQIRQQNQNFQLGTGLKAQESFRSVPDIIAHYSKSPLLLIDAKNRSASLQNQCLLSDPAGFYMTGPTWS